MSRDRCFSTTIRLVRLFAVLALLQLCPRDGSSGRALAAWFSGVGQFREGDFGTGAGAVSADGAIVLGNGRRYENSFADYYDTFVWCEGAGILSLTSPSVPPDPDYPVSYLQGNDISEGGTSVAATRWHPLPAFKYEATIWTADNGEVKLPDLPNGIGEYRAFGISDDGAVIVGHAFLSEGVEAFRWTQATGTVSLGDLPGGMLSSTAYAVSGDGSTIVGIANSAEGPQAFFWTEPRGLVGLRDVFGGIYGSFANAVSHDGRVIVGAGVTAQSGGTIEAFRWTETDGFQILGDALGSGVGTNALAVSGDGSVIGGVHRTGDENYAFVWNSQHGLRNLRSILLADPVLGPLVENWQLNVVQDISRDGLTLVGSGTNPKGVSEGWVLRLDQPLSAPEPSAMAIAALGLLWAHLASRRTSSARRPC